MLYSISQQFLFLFVKLFTVISRATVRYVRCMYSFAVMTINLVCIIASLVEYEQISEDMDFRTRRALLSSMVGKAGKRMDTLLIPLELLCCISRTEFSDKKSYIKWQKRQVSSLSFYSSPSLLFPLTPHPPVDFFGLAVLTISTHTWEF